MAAWVAATMDGFSVKLFSTSRPHWLAAYFSSSAALKPRNSLATPVMALVAEKKEEAPVSSSVVTIRGGTMRTILSTDTHAFLLSAEDR